MKIFNRFLTIVMVMTFVLGMTNTAFAATSVNLGIASNFAVLGGSTITNTGSTVINGDLGLYPGTSVSGFPPGVVNGTQHITDTVAAQAKTDLVTAYDAANLQTSTSTVSGDLGGLTLTPGVYTSSSSLGLTGTLTLDGQGNSNAVFIFQIGSTLTTASDSRIVLTNGAQACNIFWVVGTSATLGTNSNFSGSIMAMTSITVTTGATVAGSVLARNGAVTLDTDSVSKQTCTAPIIIPPTPVVIPPTTTPTPIITQPIVTTPPVVTSNPTTPFVLPAGTTTLPVTGLNLSLLVMILLGLSTLAILAPRGFSYLRR